MSPCFDALGDDRIDASVSGGGGFLDGSYLHEDLGIMTVGLGDVGGRIAPKEH
jgi:hypothetical protein